jgi:membrane protein
MNIRHVRLKGYVTLLEETFRRWRAVRPELLAGGLAYFAILSATPLLVLLVGFLRPVVAKAHVMAQLDDVLSPRAGSLVREWLLPANGSGLATLTTFSALVLLYGASQVFINLRASLDVIWDVPVRNRPSWRGLFKSTVAPLLMILAAGLLILAFVLLDAGSGIAIRMFGTALPGLDRVAIWKIVSLICSLALLTLFFGGIFKLVPSRAIRWRDVWLGAALTSGLFSLGKLVLALYFSWQSFDSLYGTVGSLIVIMVWVYTSALIFLFGAVFTRVSLKKREG